jgi:uncharacterized coiled-coil DUF342 family protein
MSVAGCHRSGATASAQDSAAVRKSFDDLNTRLKTLETEFGDLRKKVDTIPAELPNYRETRETFFATEEGRGVVDAKMTLLSTRLEAAIASHKPEDLQELSKELATTETSVGQLEQLHVTLLHQVMALQRLAEKQQQARAAESRQADGKAATQAAAKAPAAKQDDAKAKPARRQAASP